MTARTESQLMELIDAELQTLLGNITAGETAVGALLATLSLDIGAPAGASITADLVTLETEAGTMLTAS